MPKSGKLPIQSFDNLWINESICSALLVIADWVRRSAILELFWCWWHFFSYCTYAVKTWRQLNTWKLIYSKELSFIYFIRVWIDLPEYRLANSRSQFREKSANILLPQLLPNVQFYYLNFNQIENAWCVIESKTEFAPRSACTWRQLNTWNLMHSNEQSFIYFIRVWIDLQECQLTNLRSQFREKSAKILLSQPLRYVRFDSPSLSSMENAWCIIESKEKFVLWSACYIVI